MKKKYKHRYVLVFISMNLLVLLAAWILTNNTRKTDNNQAQNNQAQNNDIPTFILTATCFTTVCNTFLNAFITIQNQEEQLQATEKIQFIGDKLSKERSVYDQYIELNMPAYQKFDSAARRYMQVFSHHLPKGEFVVDDFMKSEAKMEEALDGKLFVDENYLDKWEHFYQELSNLYKKLRKDNLSPKELKELWSFKSRELIPLFDELNMLARQKIDVNKKVVGTVIM